MFEIGLFLLEPEPSDPCNRNFNFALTFLSPMPFTLTPCLLNIQDLGLAGTVKLTIPGERGFLHKASLKKELIKRNNFTIWYSRQHVRLYKTVKLHQCILNLIDFTIEHRFDWEYLTVSTNLSRCCPYT
jgi:hypothetical protein